MLNINHNPWMGLASYDVGDSDLFFGRDIELEKTNEIIHNNLSTVIYGESGVGKTSLIRAGLFPRLMQDKYLPVWIRLEHDSDEDYCSQIEHAILEEVDKNGCEIEFSHKLDQNLLTSSERLWLLLYSSIIWDKDNKKVHPVIFFDQFEEIFTLTSSHGIVKSFFKDIADFSQQVPNSKLIAFLEENDCKLVPEGIPQIRFVYSLREDFLGAMEDAASECLFLFKNKIRITKLNGEQALDAIVKPYPGLIDYPLEYNILKVLSGQDELPEDLTRIEIEPTILSLYCSELYVKACEMNLSSLTPDLVLSSGTDVIYDYYLKSLRGLHKKTINYIERELLTKSGFRKQLLADDIDSVILPKTVIDHLINKRIIRAYKRKDILSYEFTHDVLCSAAKRNREALSYATPAKTSIAWGLDIFINLFILYSILSSYKATHELAQEPLGMILFISSIFGSMLMRAVNYVSALKVKSAAIINLLLSILFVVLLQRFSIPFRPLLQFGLIFGTLFHLTFIFSKNHITLIDALKSFPISRFITPLKLALLGLVSVLCYHAGTIMHSQYSLFCSIAAILVFEQISLSFIINRTYLKFSHKLHLLCIAALLWLSIYYRFPFLLYVIVFYGYFILRNIPAKVDFQFFIHENNRFKSVFIAFLLGGFVLISDSSTQPIFGYQFHGEYKNLSRASSEIIYIIPENRISSPESYLLDITSMKERRNVQMILAKNEAGQLGLYHKHTLVLPTDFAAIGNIVRYKSSKINDDGTINLSDYLIRVKVNVTDSTFSIVHLSDYLYLPNRFSNFLKAELETYYHSSSSARRRLSIYMQEQNTDNDDKESFVQRIKEKISGEKDKDDTYNLKWLVLANRMKELLVLEESKITGHRNVNDLCEIFRKGLKTDMLNLSPEFTSAIQFLNALGEDPSVFTSDEILLKCQNLGLETAVKENLDILAGDPDFEIYVSHYSQPETEGTETDGFSAEELL